MKVRTFMYMCVCESCVSPVSARPSSVLFVAYICAHARCFFRKTTEGKGGVSLLLVAEKKRKRKREKKNFALFFALGFHHVPSYQSIVKQSY